MEHFKNYIDFKKKHDYSQNDLDFEANQVPITAINYKRKSLDVVFHRDESKARVFRKFVLDAREKHRLA